MKRIKTTQLYVFPEISKVKQVYLLVYNELCTRLTDNGKDNFRVKKKIKKQKEDLHVS